MTKFTELVKVDDRGRIVIPGSTRKVMKLVTGTKLLMEVDDENNEIKLKPFLGQDVKPVKIRLLMTDEKGALAKITTVIGEMGINLLYEEAHVVRKGVQAEWEAIADLATITEPLDVDQIKERILDTKVAIDVMIEKYD
jgi:bifunctional DNA-binding transcriptional regulator/antitoxin component of YhaV-PrlF toxin-antitoxin module